MVLADELQFGKHRQAHLFQDACEVVAVLGYIFQYGQLRQLNLLL